MLAAAIEAELAFYAIRPSKAEVFGQLLLEGLLFRKANRTDPVERARRAKRRLGEPFHIDI
jgi:hypothetical protein